MARKGVLISAAALAACGAFVFLRTRQAENDNPPQGHFVEVDGVHLHYVEHGSGDPLVLLHGNGSLMQDFLTSGLVQRAARKHRVIVFDRPGYGWSDRPRNRAWTPAAQADLLHAAALKLGVQRAHVLGHSWGTLIAVEWALRHPDSVSALTLESGYYFPTARVDALLLAGPAFPVLGDVMRLTISPLLGRLMWPGVLRKLFGPAPTPEHFKEVPRAFILSPLSIRASAEEAAMMVPSARKLECRYAELKVPVAIIAGEGDRIVDTDAQSRRLHEAISGSRMEVVKGVGHMVHHSDLDAVVGTLS